MARVGILGGTFNPPHVGHVACARAALERLGLDRVLLMPVAAPPLKQAEADPGAEARLALCRAAADGVDGVEVADEELRRGGVSYTVDTLAALHEREPQDELIFIAGADAALTLPRWREPERLLQLARLAVAERPGTSREEVRAAVAGVRGADERVEFFAMPPVEASSIEVRRRLAAGEPYAELVPAAVAEAIEREGLYGAPSGAGR